MTLYLGNNLISGTQTLAGESRNIGQIIPSAIPLTDAGLHLLDGALINGSGIYSAFVNAIADLVTDYPDLFETEAEWQTSVNTYGVCGKFVYTNEISATMPSLGTLTGTRNPSSDMDAGSLRMRYAWYVPELSGDIFTVSETPSVGDAIWVYQNGSWINSGINIETVNHSVRLPKVTGILEGTTDVTALGDLVEAGLPNITGNFYHNMASTPNSDGAFSGSDVEHFGRGSASGSSLYVDYNFNASRSNSIYGNSSTVQPQTIKCHYYIVIATSTKTDIQVDIDEIATDLNSKADVDLSNVPSSKGILTESYINGTSWYRIYSDGWCEQGGATSVGADAPIRVTLLKAYTNNLYSVQITINGTASSPNSNTFPYQALGKTASSFIVANYNSGPAANNYYQWQACGYIR